ncbi:MAG: transcriptional repressor [Hyphomicrobium sp.]
MIVLAARDYPDVDELHSRVRAANPRISLATLYRTLRLLAESGLIERHTFRGGSGPLQTGRGRAQRSFDRRYKRQGRRVPVRYD